MRQHVADLQRNITRAQTEATTGRQSDPVAALAQDNAQRISFSATSDRLIAISDANQIVAGRLSSTQLGLGAIGTALDTMSQTLTLAVGGSISRALLQGVTASAVESLSDSLNTRYGNTHVFGGTATDRPPIGDLGAARTTLETEFQSYFGFPVSDVAVPGISADDLTVFLTTVAEPLLTGAAWTGDISNGSDEAIRARIATDQTATVSLTANEPALRTGFVAAFLVSELSQVEFNDQALGALAAHTLSMAGNGSSGAAELQGQAGLIEEKLSITNERLLAQSNRLQQDADGMISVDAFEAASRFNTLVTQLETAYTLTSRLQQLSLMRFIAP